MRIHLLDYLAYVLHCNVSDLKHMDDERIAYQVMKIKYDECLEDEWNDCMKYIYPDFSDEYKNELARCFLIGIRKAESK